MIYFLAIVILFFPIMLLQPTKFIHKENLPQKNKRTIFTCNHYSNWDPIIFMIYLRPRRFKILCKKEFFKNKFIGGLFKGVGAIEVDRDNPSPKTYKEVMTQLKNDGQLFIFPEGTRNKSGSKELLDIKSGFLTFASRGETEITPMLMYRKPKIFRKNYVIVAKPFVIQGENPKKLTKEELEENLERYLKVLEDLRKELDEFVERKKNKKC